MGAAVNRLTTEERTKVVSCLVEGVSQRATVRITGVAKKTPKASPPSSLPES